LSAGLLRHDRIGASVVSGKQAAADRPLIQPGLLRYLGENGVLG